MRAGSKRDRQKKIKKNSSATSCTDLRVVTVENARHRELKRRSCFFTVQVVWLLLSVCAGEEAVHARRAAAILARIVRATAKAEGIVLGDDVKRSTVDPGPLLRQRHAFLPEW